MVMFEVLPHHMSDGTEENHKKKKFSQCRQSLDQDVNLGPPNFKAAVLPIQLQHSAEGAKLYLNLGTCLFPSLQSTTTLVH